MPLKYRGPYRQFAGGSYLSFGWLKTTQAPSVFYSGKGRLSTVNSPGPPYFQQNSFEVRYCEGEPGTFNGTRSDGTRVFSGWRVTDGINWSSTIDGSMTISSLPSAADRQLVLNNALSRVNFAKPVIYLPTFLWELKEFPRMLQDLGRVLSLGTKHRASDVPGAHLAWQFGWAPLFGDLAILMDLGNAIEQNQKRFKEAKARLKREGRLGVQEDRWTVTPSSGVSGLSIRREWSRTVERWWSAHWDVLEDYPDFLFGSIYDQYVNALGLNKPYGSIWNAMPWSWLIDYFTNVGTFIEATEGLAEYKPAKVCVMIHIQERVQREEGNASPTYAAGWTYSPTSYEISHKERTVYTDPQARPVFEPFGFENHLSILASLVTARKLRSLNS